MRTIGNFLVTNNYFFHCVFDISLNLTGFSVISILVSAKTAFYNETEIAVNITEVEEQINETVIVPVQVAPTGMYL